jgi:hypothetical protein
MPCRNRRRSRLAMSISRRSPPPDGRLQALISFAREFALSRSNVAGNIEEVAAPELEDGVPAAVLSFAGLRAES